MSTISDQYRAQAIRAQAEADSAILANVKERSERSAKVWTEMADRADRLETMRERRAP